MSDTYFRDVTLVACENLVKSKIRNKIVGGCYSNPTCEKDLNQEMTLDMGRCEVY